MEIICMFTMQEIKVLKIKNKVFIGKCFYLYFLMIIINFIGVKGFVVMIVIDSTIRI